MPPRFSYWTIILDGVPTAFRARHREDLLPTFKQLQHTNPDAVMKWFARGRIWESPEEAAGTLRQAREATGRKREGERRGPDWRPGGKHVDPRARYKKSARKDREGGEGKGTWRDRRRQAGGAEQRKGGWRDRPAA